MLKEGEIFTLGGITCPIWTGVTFSLTCVDFSIFFVIKLCCNRSLVQSKWSVIAFNWVSTMSYHIIDSLNVGDASSYGSPSLSGYQILDIAKFVGPCELTHSPLFYVYIPRSRHSFWPGQTFVKRSFGHLGILSSSYWGPPNCWEHSPHALYPRLSGVARVHCLWEWRS